MFENRVKRLICIAAGLLLIYGTSLLGQQEAAETAALKRQALEQFENGQYHMALSAYMELLALEENEPMHRYYAGRCMVELNESLDEAIELLYGASRHQVPADVNYYLGLAYQRDYNFHDARSYFEKFSMTASRQAKKELDTKLLIATCRSATEITSSYNPFNVVNVTFLNLLDSVQFSQVKMKGGHLSRKPQSYFKAGENREELGSLMFIPKEPLRGDFVYYAGPGRSAKEGSQLFRLKKGAGRSWSDPEELTALNSSGDEILPYFDPIEEDIYFASNGRSGVGGFDLYRAHYDSERNQWTEPTNLGFPVNSVMDEYLLLPGSDMGMVLFFSNRQGTDSTVTVYRVHLSEPKKKTRPNDSKMLKEIAQLGGVAEDILAELHGLDRVAETPIEKAVTVTTMPEKANADRPKDSQKRVYQEILAEALAHQAVSDSLKDLAAHARVQVRNSEDPNDRWVWQKQIMVWEKRARDEEVLADQLYAEMKIEKERVEQGHAVNPPETIVVDRVVDDMTVYRYAATDEGRPDLSEPSPRPTQTPSPSPPKNNTLKEEAAKPALHVTNRFEILARSPYTKEHPIPMDVSLPDGAFYRIQLGAFGSEVDPGVFGGISPVSGEHIEERSIIKYYAGKFTRYGDASEALSAVRSRGYEDAFVVAWYNGQQVPTQKAKQLE